MSTIYEELERLRRKKDEASCSAEKKLEADGKTPADPPRVDGPAIPLLSMTRELGLEQEMTSSLLPVRLSAVPSNPERRQILSRGR